MRICITGRPDATESALIQQLGEAGFDLALVEGPDSIATFEVPGLRRTRADLSVPGVWQSLLDGCDLVLHCPGRLEPAPADPEDGRSDTMVLDPVDTMFQVVWGIEQADQPPEVLVVLLPGSSDPSAIPGLPAPASALERVATEGSTGDTRTLICRSADPVEIARCLGSAVRSVQSRRSGPMSQPPPGGSLLFSLDEFLLDGATAPHPNRVRLLQRLRQEGMAVVLTTARPAHLVPGLVGSTDAADLVIAGDGSVLVDPHRKEVLRTELIEPDHVLGVGLAVRTLDDSIGLQVERGMHAYSNHPRKVPAGLDWLFSGGTPVDFQQLLQRPATRILLHGRPRRLRASVRVISETPGIDRTVRMVEYAADCLGVLGPTADRSVALQRAESILGVSRYSTLVCIGKDDAHLADRWKRHCTWSGSSMASTPGMPEISPEASSTDPLHHLLRRLEIVRPPMSSD